MRRTRWSARLILAGALVGAAAVAGCTGDTSGSVLPPRSNQLPALISSAPVQSLAPSAPVHILGRNVPPTAGVVYVSLPPGSVPAGFSATIRDVESGQAVTAAVVDGGFDPVAITATIGDTLLVAVQPLGSVSATLGYLTVSASSPPVVVRTSPPPKKVDVPLNAFMVAVFSTPLDAATVNTSSIALWRGTTPVPGTVRLADDAHVRVEFHPDSPLAGQTDYQLILGKSIHDVNRVALDSAVTVPFTTATTPPAPVTIPWTTKASMPTPRWGLGIGVVNGILYAVGGYDARVLGTVEAYDPATDSWTTKAAMPTPRHGLAVGIVNGILYAVGGDTTSAESGFDLPVATVEAYDPATNSWTTKTSIPAPGGEFAIGVVNGILYAIGGDVLGGTVVAYDPATDSWTTKASMPTPRTGVAIGVVSGLLYAVGGVDRTGVLESVEAYDPVTNSWTTKASMPTPRREFSVGVVNGILYAVGGFNGGFLGTFDAYNPATNSWTTRAETLTPRDDLSVSVVNGVLYAVGGFDRSPGSLGIVESLAP